MSAVDVALCSRIKCIIEGHVSLDEGSRSFCVTHPPPCLVQPRSVWTQPQLASRWSNSRVYNLHQVVGVRITAE